MAEQQAEQPFVYRFKKVYLKDASFESPSAPEIFLIEWEQEVSLDYELTHAPTDEENGFYEVALVIKVAAKRRDKPTFIAEVQQAGIFQIGGIADEDVRKVLEISCANILMPFAREAVCDLVVKGGFPQLLIDPIDFQAVYEAQHGVGTGYVSDPNWRPHFTDGP
ncbi:MAG: protein-export chaperone SecB [Acidiferrobacterales bacterium]